MSPKKDANKVAKTPSKRKETQPSTPVSSSTPKRLGYGPVDDAELVWAVLYQAADAPKPNYQRAAELLGMPYQTLFSRFARIKKLHEGTPTSTPTSKPRKARKSKEALTSELDAPMIKDADGAQSDSKDGVMVKVEVEAKAKETEMDKDEA